MLRLFRNENGFTLIEILVVVLIIGIIAAIAIPNLLSAQKTAWSKTCLANCSSLKSAAELYRIQNSGVAPTAMSNLTTALSGYEKVMNSIPKCPSGKENTYSFVSGTTDVTCSEKGADKSHP